MPTDGLMCWNCGEPTGIMGKVSRADACEKCLADLRCCRGCRHFDPTRRFQCKEPVETNIVNKEKANFCEFFQMRNVMKRPGGISTQSDTKEARKKKFDDLFKD
ncbi:MAG: hypothetical protein PHU88_07810 [candidate division Zixibacteria bacterium]|nr:hypothetical protein [candidate division Zixibacteria bacterium]MDD5425843.1 hypothetical protein [candidate division Zixibacteria bacterium]